jgi:sodium-dependent dicarboxylate transporter 2/3/5
MKAAANTDQIKLIVALLIPLLLIFIPASFYPLPGLTEVERRVIIIFAFATAFWILEPIPIYATSIAIITLLLLTSSDSGFIFLRGEGEVFGELLSYRGIMATFASPIILLFLGGFFLALAAKKYGLDQNLAIYLLRPFGTKPSTIMLGIMIITAIFSMFMSNTATTAMMLSILVPVLSAFKPGDTGQIGFVLAVPMAANLGGIGTPIGTPPNAIALKYLTDQYTINFSTWMAFGVPFVVVLILLAWIILRKLYPMELETMKLDLNTRFQRSPKALLVYVTFVLTILLWLTDFLHGLNSYTVAMVPVAVFLAFGVINKEDLKKLSWDVLWLVSGGIKSM